MNFNVESTLIDIVSDDTKEKLTNTDQPPESNFLKPINPDDFEKVEEEKTQEIKPEINPDATEPKKTITASEATTSGEIITEAIDAINSKLFPFIYQWKKFTDEDKALIKKIRSGIELTPSEQAQSFKIKEYVEYKEGCAMSDDTKKRSIKVLSEYCTSKNIKVAENESILFLAAEIYAPIIFPLFVDI